MIILVQFASARQPRAQESTPAFSSHLCKHQAVELQEFEICIMDWAQFEGSSVSSGRTINALLRLQPARPSICIVRFPVFQIFDHMQHAKQNTHTQSHTSPFRTL